MTTSLDRPDEHAAEAANEAYCWMPATPDRECGADCVAFDARSVSDPKIGSCMVLNSLRSIGGSLAKLASLQDVRVPAPSPPTVPLGGR